MALLALPTTVTGYTEAWYLPAAGNIPRTTRPSAPDSIFSRPKPETATASTGNPNVYAGPAGFYLIRGGPAGDDEVLDSSTGATALLPGPAPRENDKFPPNKTYYEIPIAIQDRSFNTAAGPAAASRNRHSAFGAYRGDVEVLQRHAGRSRARHD